MGMAGAMTPRQAPKHDHCRFCSIMRPAWLPVPQALAGAMWLGHLAQQYPAMVRRFPSLMHII
jgi:hypothetical protein